MPNAKKFEWQHYKEGFDAGFGCGFMCGASFLLGIAFVAGWVYWMLS